MGGRPVDYVDNAVELAREMLMLRLTKIHDHAAMSGFGAVDYAIYVTKQLSQLHSCHPPFALCRPSGTGSAFLILSVLP
jgi:hypothetical protein